MLASVSLVVHGSRGHQCVFSYPSVGYLEEKEGQAAAATGAGAQAADGGARPHSGKAKPGGLPPKDEQRKDGKDGDENAIGGAGSGTSNSEQLPGAAAVAPMTAAEAALQVHGYPPDLFADMMTPKPILCNRPFCLAVDDLEFVSFPSSFRDDPGLAELVAKRAQQAERQGGADKGGNEPKSADGSSGAPKSLAKGSPAKKEEKEEIFLFNVVLALRGTFLERTRIDVQPYVNVARQLSTAIRHEEARVSYLSTEVRRIADLRDSFVPDANCSNLTDMLLQCSSLANMLRRLYMQLDNGVRLTVNGWITLSFSLSRPVVSSLGIRPYQSLVLLDTEARILSQLGEDASDELKIFINHVHPGRSFMDLSLETSIPVVEIMRLAAHLVYWSKARVINVLSKHSVYIMASTRQGIRHSLNVLFAKTFRDKQGAPTAQLATVLARFSTARPLGDILDDLPTAMRPEFPKIVIWLLRYQLLVQVHQYIYLAIDQRVASSGHAGAGASDDDGPLLQVIPEEDSDSGTCPWGSDGGSDMEDELDLDAMNADLVDDEDLLPLSPANRRFVLSIRNDTEMWRLFKRLCRHFNGQYHVEEILYRTGIERHDLNMVLSTYKDVLHSCLHRSKVRA